MVAAGVVMLLMASRNAAEHPAVNRRASAMKSYTLNVSRTGAEKLLCSGGRPCGPQLLSWDLKATPTTSLGNLCLG